MDWEPQESCHLCDEPIAGEPAGRGLLLFPRGDHLESEEPALCESCSKTLDASAYHRFWLLSEG